MEKRPQTFQNHAKWDPIFHFFLAPMALVLVGWSIRTVIVLPTLESALHLVMAIAAFLLIFKARALPLRVQDRVIRLEETLRIRELAPDLASRVGELSSGQFTSLRFASDAELPALLRKVLDEKLAPKQIKEAIVTWKPDYHRV